MTSAQRIARTTQFLSQVSSVRQLSPRMRRITLAAPEISHVRWPLGCDVALILTGEDGREVRRRYTVASHQDAEVTVDALLHGRGPGSLWAASAVPGDDLSFFGPRGEIPLPQPAVSSVLAITDESGLPAVGALAGALPPAAGLRVIAEITDDAERYPLPDHVTVEWLTRNGRPAGGAGPLLQTLDSLRLAPDSIGFGYVLAESRAAVVIRDALQLPRDSVYAKGYWNLNSRPTK